MNCENEYSFFPGVNYGGRYSIKTARLREYIPVHLWCFSVSVLVWSSKRLVFAAATQGQKEDGQDEGLEVSYVES